MNCFAFLLLNFMSSSYILDINPSSDMWFANIFSHSINYLHFLDAFVCCAEYFLVWCSLTCLFLLLLPLILHLKNFHWHKYHSLSPSDLFFLMIGYSGSFVAPYTFYNCLFYFFNRYHWSFDRDSMESVCRFG